MIRDMDVEDLRFKHEMASIDNQIKTLEMDRRDPSSERRAEIVRGTAKGLLGGASIYAQGHAKHGGKK